MTCGLVDGVEIKFLKSGIRIRPYEINTRSDWSRYSHVKARISREAGELIGESHTAHEPVEVLFDGIVQDRYYMAPTGVQLGNEDAHLTLYDGLKVMERGTLNRKFNNHTLKEVIEYLVTETDDPQNVITGIVHPDQALSDIRISHYEGQSASGIAGEIEGALVTFLGGTLRGLPTADTSIKFKKETPAEGLFKAASRFGFTPWVEDDGSLHYEFRGANPDTYAIGPSDDDFRLKEYNVTTGSGLVNQVILRGRYHYITNTQRGPYGIKSPKTYAYGRAWLPDVDGYTIEPTEPVDAHKPKAVENLARRKLVEFYMSIKSGNIVINSGASEQTGPLTEMKVGDYISAGAEIGEHCNRDVDTGIFVVQRVQHKIDTRRGWLTTATVAAIPHENIQSESWLENLATGETWDSVKDHPSGN